MLNEEQKAFKLEIRIKHKDSEIAVFADCYYDHEDQEIVLNEQVIEVNTIKETISMLDNHLSVSDRKLEEYAEHLKLNLFNNLSQLL